MSTLDMDMNFNNTGAFCRADKPGQAHSHTQGARMIDHHHTPARPEAIHRSTPTRALQTMARSSDVCIFWDNSNIFIPAQDVAREQEGSIVGRDLRIQFNNLYELSRAGRRIVSGVCVGSLHYDMSAIWDRLRDIGVTLELFERGQGTGREQAVDQALQVHMLRSVIDLAPGTAVLLTGDGAGAHEGKGYFADLQRMHNNGWKVEVLSWRNSCHSGLRNWAEANGRFIALDDYYSAITFVKGLRTSTRLPRQSR